MTQPTAQSGSALVLQTLAQRFGYEVVTQSITDNQVRVEGRIRKEHSRNWIVGMDYILAQEEKQPWSVDISRHYFRQGGVTKWAWRLIFQYPDIDSVCSDIVGVLNSSPRARFEVEEQALPGVTGQRHTMTQRGKGMAPAGTVPLLIRQRAGQ